MTETSMPLAAGFPMHTHDDWLALAAKVVNRGKAPEAQRDGAAAEEALRSHLSGGITIDPLYLRPERATATGEPGAMPFTRGAGLRDAGRPWDVRQLHDDPDAAATRAAVLTDLERGVSSIWVHVGADGLTARDLAQALADVRLDLAPVVVSSWDDQPAAADALLRVLETAGPGALGGNLGLDPVGAAARVGGTPDLTPLADAVRTCLDHAAPSQPADGPTAAADPGARDGAESPAGSTGLRAITVDTRPFHEAGASAVDEIALAVANAVGYVRHLEAAGIEVADAFGQIDFRLAVTQDQFLTAATLRALRRLWARVGELAEVPEAQRGARTHAVTSLRMYTRDDPWVNVLRATLAAFGASVGGADAITVLPFDTVSGLPTTFSRRLARNTQLLLADESNVGRVTDPGGGGWYLESLTDELATAAWATIQDIEGAGGVAAMLADGSLATRLADAHTERAAQIATRRIPLTGVSMFPLADEAPVARTPRAALPTTDAALPVHRDSAAFEGLRDRARALGDAARVTVRTLGSQRDFGPRETFVTNLLAAGGLGAGDAAGPIAILASSPAGYAAHAAEAIEQLRSDGVARVFVAGRASELGDASERVDGEVRDGMDVVALLDSLLTQLGAPAEGDQA